MIWVLDASVAVRWFLKDERHPNADAVLGRLIDHPEFFGVPELFCFEVYAVLCRIHPSGQDAFLKGMIPILNSGILRQPMTGSLATQASRYVERGLTGYDACYAALALAMLPLLRKSGGHGLRLTKKPMTLLPGSGFRTILRKLCQERGKFRADPVVEKVRGKVRGRC